MKDKPNEDDLQPLYLLPSVGFMALSAFWYTHHMRAIAAQSQNEQPMTAFEKAVKKGFRAGWASFARNQKAMRQ